MLNVGSKKPMRRVRLNRGVSLIEVLISILLSAIGLLALAGANVASVRYSKMSQYRGTATLLASDLAERMRANKTALSSYEYTTDFSGQSGAIASPTPTCQGSYSIPACTLASDLANYDLKTWQQLVRNQLPEGSVFVYVGGSTTGADVWLAWRDPSVALPSENSTDARNNAGECPNGLNLGTDLSIRCSYFRINL